MSERLRPPSDPVALTLDGERVVAERGEPVAAALLGAGKLTLARSPKFHRPRGPACMRGACDGCLARVDGVPNVMTCLTPAREGITVESQNTLGSREVDLLRMTDWFFPEGMNHHELFAGVPGVQGAMQAFARRVAGLGRLPDQTRPVKPAARRRVDVLVVGCGAAGMAVAVAAARTGRQVEVVEDALAPGGGTRGLLGEDARPFDKIREAFEQVLRGRDVVLRVATAAAGFYGKDLLVVGPSGAEVVEAAAFVIAAGAHDGVMPFENNDLPGVMSARAACLLLASGILVGRKVIIAGSGEEARITFGRAFERAALASGVKVEVTRVKDVVRIKGSSHVRGVVVHDGKGERSIVADAVLVDARRSAAYELPEQAGAKLTHRGEGFVPEVDGKGRIADGVWAVGEVTGAPLDPVEFVRAADVIARDLPPRTS